jgi:hypothetical protein
VVGLRREHVSLEVCLNTLACKILYIYIWRRNGGNERGKERKNKQKQKQNKNKIKIKTKTKTQQKKNRGEKKRNIHHL